MQVLRTAVAGSLLALSIAAGCSGDNVTTGASGAGSAGKSPSGDAGSPDAEAGSSNQGGTESQAGSNTVAGSPAGGAPVEGECSLDQDCTVIESYPPDCAEAKCIEGSCRYVARDADGDGFGAKRCQSMTPGVVVERGEDCDDALDYVSPSGWDGPAGDGFENGCNDELDQDCNGTVDDGVLVSGATCICDPGDTRACSAFPNGQAIEFPAFDPNGAPLGACRRGSQECQVNGVYGPCTGAVAPKGESCAGEDDDCDGVPSLEDLSAVDRSTWVCDQDRDEHLAGDAQKESACSQPTGCANGVWRENPDAGDFDDCDDTDGEIFLGHQELCDGKDNNCNLDIDENAYDEILWSYDGDGDSFRDARYAVLSQCDAPKTAPTGCVGTCPANAWHGGGAPLPLGDCDDNNPAKNPSAKDPCNGVDMDCDGSTLSGCACSNNQTQPCGTHPGYDGKGICTAGTEKCTGGVWGGCVGSQGRKVEACGAEDLDCDGTAGSSDPDAFDRVVWACDADLDGFLAPNAVTYTACSPPAGVTCAGKWLDNPNVGLFSDCQDSDGNIHPGADERCNRLDDDCSSSAGQTTPAVVAAEDSDQDGHTNSNYAGKCSGGYPLDDCDDTNADVHPGQSKRFAVPYGCTYPCYQPATGEYRCGTTAACTKLTNVGPFFASFDYNCANGAEKPPVIAIQLGCARVQNQCTYAEGWVDVSADCGQPATFRSCKIKPGGLPNQVPSCSLQDEQVALPCR